MAQSEAEWLEQHAQRLLTAQKGEADAAKLLATFVAAIAATLVATALQVGATANGLDVAGAIALGACVVATVAVILLDRLRVPDHTKILDAKSALGWDEATTLGAFRLEELATVRYNTRVVRRVRFAVAVQGVLAFAAGTLATVSLLVPDVG